MESNKVRIYTFETDGVTQEGEPTSILSILLVLGTKTHGDDFSMVTYEIDDGGFYTRMDCCRDWATMFSGHKHSRGFLGYKRVVSSSPTETAEYKLIREIESDPFIRHNNYVNAEDRYWYGQLG